MLNNIDVKDRSRQHLGGAVRGTWILRHTKPSKRGMLVCSYFGAWGLQLGKFQQLSIMRLNLEVLLIAIAAIATTSIKNNNLAIIIYSLLNSRLAT